MPDMHLLGTESYVRWHKSGRMDKEVIKMDNATENMMAAVTMLNCIGYSGKWNTRLTGGTDDGSLIEKTSRRLRGRRILWEAKRQEQFSQSFSAITAEDW
jgi:hypothetical protein